MDLRAYYQKIRKIEAEIGEASVVIVSRDNGDGGRAGVLTDVPRAAAARMIADGRADLASAEEEHRFRSEAEERWKSAHESSWGARKNAADRR